MKIFYRFSAGLDISLCVKVKYTIKYLLIKISTGEKSAFENIANGTFHRNEK